MTQVAEPADRARIDDSGDALEVVIPVKWDSVRVIFLTVWIVGWIWGGVHVIRRFSSGDIPQGDRTFVMLWLAFWALATVFGVASWLWNIAGVERARFRSDAVLLRREVFGVGVSNEYDAGRVGKLRLSDDYHKGSDEPRPRGAKVGKIAFDYEESTVHFGLRLDRGEAARIILKIQKRFAFTRS